MAAESAQTCSSQRMNPCLEGLNSPSMDTASCRLARKAVGVSCSTACVPIRCRRYSKKRRRNCTKCSARLMLPGTCTKTCNYQVLQVSVQRCYLHRACKPRLHLSGEARWRNACKAAARERMPCSLHFIRTTPSQDIPQSEHNCNSQICPCSPAHRLPEDVVWQRRVGQGVVSWQGAARGLLQSPLLLQARHQPAVLSPQPVSICRFDAFDGSPQPSNVAACCIQHLLPEVHAQGLRACEARKG